MLKVGIKYSKLEVMENLNYFSERKELLCKRLDKLGYEYKSVYGGFIFSKVPAIIAKLDEDEKEDNYKDVVKDFISRYLGKRINENAEDYALNFVLYHIDLGEEVDYNRATYQQRIDIMESILDRKTVSKVTLSTWTNDLISKNILQKTSNKDLFCTYWIDGKKKQLNVDMCENEDVQDTCRKEYNKYKKVRANLLKQYNGDWSKATNDLLHMFNCIYYFIPPIYMNIHFMEEDWLNFLDACGFWLIKLLEAKDKKELQEKQKIVKIKEERAKKQEEDKEQIIKAIENQQKAIINENLLIEKMFRTNSNIILHRKT